MSQETLTMLWFFLIISWSGDIAIKHGYKNADTCMSQREQVVAQVRATIREVTTCIGIPLNRKQTGLG